MSGPRRPPPSLRALMSFRAAAAHDRIADAAAELGVTESAVSHQIRQLEKTLHVQLFDRSTGRLTLTEAGRSYLARIAPALKEIQDATDALSPDRGRTTVRLTLPPSLAATWLIPRIGAWEAGHPDVELQLVATTRVVDLVRDVIDLAIRYGRGDWPGVDAAFLFSDLATPVCAPGVVAQGSAPSNQVLSGVRLLINRAIPDEWGEWARARGLEAPTNANAITLDAIEQVLQAAEAGSGLAMGRSPYIEERLARGTLVAPFGSAGPTGAAYFLCTPSAATPTAAARRVVRWLNEQAAAFEQERREAEERARPT